MRQILIALALATLATGAHATPKMDHAKDQARMVGQASALHIRCPNLPFDSAQFELLKKQLKASPLHPDVQVDYIAQGVADITNAARDYPDLCEGGWFDVVISDVLD